MSFAAIFVGPHFVGDLWQRILLQLQLNIVNLEYLTDVCDAVSICGLVAPCIKLKILAVFV